MAYSFFFGVVLSMMMWLKADGPATTGSAKPQVEDDREVLMKLDREFDRETAEHGVEGWVKYFAENGSMLPRTAMPISGREAIRKAMEPDFSDSSFSLRWKPTKAEMIIEGKIGYTTGRSERIWRSKEGKRLRGHGTYVTVWIRQADQSWKIGMDTGYPDGPPEVIE